MAKRKLVLGCIALFPYITGAQFTSYDELFDRYNIEIKESGSVETNFPIQPAFISQEHGSADDLSSLVSVKLPNPRDHDRYGYLYAPKLDIIVPISEPSKEDQKKIFFGETFEHLSYFEEGALHYYGESPTYGNGNMVLAAHSSYKNNDPGRYKTIFQIVPLLRDGDIVHYYQKNKTGTYDFYIYEINKSFETTPDDVSILSQQDNFKQLTAYTCYPFGSTKNRRVIQGELLAEQRNYTSLIIHKVQSSQLKEHQAPNQSSKTHNIPKNHGVDNTLKENKSQQEDTIEYKDYELLTDTLISSSINTKTKQKYSANLSPIAKTIISKTVTNHSVRNIIKERIKNEITTNLINAVEKPKTRKKSLDKVITYIILYKMIDTPK